MSILKEVGLAISQLPENFKSHPNVAKDMKRKRTSIETGKEIDWATAEGLAFGTLLLEGNHVRLSGQASSFSIYVLKCSKGCRTRNL